MYCKQCGAPLSDSARFCKSCGAPAGNTPAAGPSAPDPSACAPGPLKGFSPRIQDPAFARYVKKSNQWAILFSLILAVAAIVGFAIAGENSSELENPQALFIGLGIGAMFVVIALLQILGRKRSATWDGTVADKTVTRKRRNVDYGDGSSSVETYLEYVVMIRGDNGKKHPITVRNDDTLYNYYEVGDRVRHHGGLKTFEKYDKSRDSIIFCNACMTKNDIRNESCSRCHCPLLK